MIAVLKHCASKIKSEVEFLRSLLVTERRRATSRSRNKCAPRETAPSRPLVIPEGTEEQRIECGWVGSCSSCCVQGSPVRHLYCDGGDVIDPGVAVLTLLVLVSR